MAKTKSEIKQEIKDYIDQNGGSYKSWYVGIAKDPKDRLFNEHSVRKDEDCWIFRTAVDSDTARDIEKYFVNDLGMDGGTGGGDEDAKSDYAYKKNSHTNP